VQGFDDATAVERGSVNAEYSAFIDIQWGIGTKPNGGYLLAIMGRTVVEALTEEGSPHRHVVAAAVTFVQAPDAGPVAITVDVLRRGRSASQVRATLSQGGTTQVEGTFTVRTLDPISTPRYLDAPPPLVAPEADCIRLTSPAPGGLPVGIMDVCEIRLDPATAGFRRGQASGVALLLGWLRLADGRESDALSLLMAVDAFPPATFELSSSGWVPTLQLSAYIRALPSPGPLMVRQRARLVDGGMVDEICEVWDAQGRMVAQGTQLAQVRFEDEVTT
jgi:Thioesterase-like superfamily